MTELLQSLIEIDRMVTLSINGSDSLCLESVAGLFTSIYIWIPLALAAIFLILRNINILKSIHTLFDTCSFIVSAIPHALLRIEATREPISWTAPIKIVPKTIQIHVGTHPKASPAIIGPVTGPAAAIAEKCCPARNFASIGS